MRSHFERSIFLFGAGAVGIIVLLRMGTGVMRGIADVRMVKALGRKKPSTKGVRMFLCDIDGASLPSCDQEIVKDRYV